MTDIERLFRRADESMPDWLNRIADNAENWQRNHVRDYIKMLAPAKGARILDFGTYMGANLIWWAYAGHECVGVDISAEFAARFERDAEGHPNRHLMTYVVSMIEDYEPDRPFQIVTCGEVLQYTIDPMPILKKARDCLVDDGELFVTVPTMAFPVFPRAYALKELEKEVEAAGFTIVENGVQTLCNTVPQYWVHGRKEISA